MSLRQLVETMIEKSRRRFLDFGTVIEVDPEKYTVRVKTVAGIETAPLRILTGYSGDGYGFVIPPAVGDEVLVCFLDGDPFGQGVVLGRLFGKDRPPNVAVKEINITHVSGTRLIVRENGKVEIETKGKVEMSVNGNVELAVQGDLDADVSGTANIKAQKVNLGKNAEGGIITDVTHPICLFTGASKTAFSSKTVKGQS